MACSGTTSLYFYKEDKIDVPEVNLQTISPHVHSVPRNSEPTYQHATALFCVVTDSLAGSSLAAAAACCRDGFHGKLDTFNYVRKHLTDLNEI
jgi:hypothetical protein